MTTGLKTCNKCQTDKPFDAFGRLSGAKDGMTYACLDCARAKTRAWRENNRDRDRASKNRWAMQNTEKLKEKSKRYYAENTEKHKAACRRWEDENRANRRKYVYAWVERNKSQKYAWNAIRRAKKINATPPWLTAIHMAQIQEMYDVAEALLVQTGVPHHVDHIHPLNGDGFNGLHVPWNLQVIPAFDNLSKHNFLPAEDQHMMWGATQ
jgi:hypothetical protein